MKEELGWWFPDHEEHMIAWMQSPKGRMEMNGRLSYQGKKQLLALSHCTSFRTAVDIGAHVGMWSYHLAHKFERVYAFEPVEEHRNCFERNVIDHLENVILYGFALGKEYGRVSISTRPTSSGDSHVSGAGDIDMRPLDSFGITSVDFMKADAEGFEENIMRGAIETIKRYKPVICVEQKRDMSKRFGLESLGAVNYLTTLGYVCAEHLSGDYIMVPPK